MKYIKMLRELSGLKKNVNRTAEQMKEILQEKNLEYVQFYVRFVNAILPNPETGKKPLIVTDHMSGMEEAV